MPKPHTGAIITTEAVRLSMSALRGCIKPGNVVFMNYRWDKNGDCIHTARITVEYTDPFPRMVIYTPHNDCRQYIDIHRRKSNLGVGDVFYFVCPVTGYLCKILYKCYNSPIFKSMGAYRNRIYYRTQIYSSANDRYFHWERKVEDLISARSTHTYRGKITRRAERIKSAERRMAEYDKLRLLHFVGMLSNYA